MGDKYIIAWETDPAHKYLFTSLFAMLSQGIIALGDGVTQEDWRAAQENYEVVVEINGSDGQACADMVDAMIADGDIDQWDIIDVLTLWMLLIGFNGIVYTT